VALAPLARLLLRHLAAGLGAGPSPPGRPPLPRGTTELRLLEALDLDGCPICRVVEGADERHLFWFLHENFTKSGYPRAWTGSLGFCSGHGELLLRREGVRLRIATTHRALLHHRRACWQQEAGASGARAAADSTVGSCPACTTRTQAAREAAGALLTLLRQPEVARRYGEHGRLCLPHLRLLAADLSRDMLERALEAQERALAEAAHRLGAGAVLQLTAETEPGVPLMPGPDDGTPPPRLFDPAETLLRDLEGAMACPVCLEMRRAWLEWLERAETSAARGDAPGDLPACPGHLWSAVQASRPKLARKIEARSLEVARSCMQAALGAVHEVAAASGFGGRLRRAALMWGGRPPEVRAALAALTGHAVCGPCRQLKAAHEGALLHLFGLLEQPEGQDAFERGYGLCVRHAASALTLRPSQRVRACLREVEAARLAALEREVAEYARKSNWHARDEPIGTEASAPERALRRFSGFLCAPLSGSSG
jgi:hypothetical protein